MELAVSGAIRISNQFRGAESFLRRL